MTFLKDHQHYVAIAIAVFGGFAYDRGCIAMGTTAIVGGALLLLSGVIKGFWNSGLWDD